MTREGSQREISPLRWDEESQHSSSSPLSSSSSSSSLPSQIRSTYLSSSSSFSSLPSQMRAHYRIGPTSARMTRGSRSEESSSELEESMPEERESESGISVPRIHSRDADPPRRIGPSRTYRSDRRRNSGNAMGRFRRFKNKLGLIFHHHHHHHHHPDDSGHSQVDNHNQSLWKSSQKMFQRSNIHDVHHDPRVQKVKRTKVNNVASKHQVGHFHALVEGLLRHVRHSRRSKPPRGLGDNIGTRGGKKGAKKLQWWKMFRRRGGVKIPKRRRVYFKKKKKKPLLKMS